MFRVLKKYIYDNMYIFLKNIIRKIIPHSLLFRIESQLRYIHYLLYKGNTYTCNVCERKLSKFQSFGIEKICPACGSLARNRRLWLLLRDVYLKKKMRVLDFSPSRSIYRNLLKEDIEYFPTDLSGDFIANYQFNITDIDVVDSFFDLIICYHILEHVVDDAKAISELFRVIKNEGVCLIQTPFKEGEIYENYSIVNEEDRRVHFGQEDHVRIYSESGLKKRLEEAGFHVDVLAFHEAQNNNYGFDPYEIIFVCKK